MLPTERIQSQWSHWSGMVIAAEAVAAVVVVVTWDHYPQKEKVVVGKRSCYQRGFWKLGRARTRSRHCWQHCDDCWYSHPYRSTGCVAALG